MQRKVIFACAGAGKSRHIAEQALKIAAAGKTVLLLTYTINNQNELLKHICLVNRYKPPNIIIKGWFTFLLEDMVRPYQRCILPDRVRGIVLDSSDPHIVDGRAILGETSGGAYNSRYFLTTQLNAHTTYLSKLAARIHELSQNKSTQRLAMIYDGIFIDEVQDLVGWDFDVIKTIADTNIEIIECVGDFRQTVYRTSVARKKPATNIAKISRFRELGFSVDTMSGSWRCLQSICAFADLVHAGEGSYPPTTSRIDKIPDDFLTHHGVFAVLREDALEYISRYDPVILRWNRLTEELLCEGNTAFNFGESKGLGFERVLVLPTNRYKSFLSGRADEFADDKKDDVKNKLYVAITRANYSVAFVLDSTDTLLTGIEQWRP